MTDIVLYHALFSTADITIADITLMPSVVRFDDIGMASMWANRPAVGQWFARSQAHPAYGATYSPGLRPVAPTRTRHRASAMHFERYNRVTGA